MPEDQGRMRMVDPANILLEMPSSPPFPIDKAEWKFHNIYSGMNVPFNLKEELS